MLSPIIKIFNMEKGFKSFNEVDEYLKSGGVIGDFYGNYGEEDHTNNFIVYNKSSDEYLHRREIYEDYSIEGNMETRNLSPVEFKNWILSLENYKDANGNIQTSLFHRNFDCSVADVMECYEK